MIGIGYLHTNYTLIAAFHQEGRSGNSRRILQMAPQLSDLFANVSGMTVRGQLARPISGVVMDSRRVFAGSLFFALPGLRTDGFSYVGEAIDRGAVAVVATRLPSRPAPGVTFIQVADPRAVLARVARRYYDEPDRILDVVGVTGTNGKTTVAHLLRLMLAGPGAPAGMLGTVSYDLGERTVPSFKTTPESLDVYGMLAQMRASGCRAAAMEISSHGIDQKRVLGIELEAAVFTNLTRDHLDYHRDLESYFEVKSRLFTGANGRVPGVAVINIDDPCGRRLAGMLPEGVRLVSFGESPDAMVRATDVESGFKGTRFTLHTPSGVHPVESPLLGHYNVSNLLAALATCHGLGRDVPALLPRLAAFTGVPGRMERIERGQPFNVLVDYAHTDDALRNALGMLRRITPGRILTVFGCGGNRDRTKRPLMTAAVGEGSDLAWATADNPRREPLSQIFSDMQAGLRDPSRMTFVEDRRRAISLALDAARPGDCLLVAGKGHETCQEFADTVVPFDDRQVVAELIDLKKLKTEEARE